MTTWVFEPIYVSCHPKKQESLSTVGSLTLSTRWVAWPFQDPLLVVLTWLPSRWVRFRLIWDCHEGEWLFNGVTRSDLHLSLTMEISHLQRHFHANWGNVYHIDGVTWASELTCLPCQPKQVYQQFTRFDCPTQGLFRHNRAPLLVTLTPLPSRRVEC